jgi:hypothetical protein
VDIPWYSTRIFENRRTRLRPRIVAMPHGKRPSGASCHGCCRVLAMYPLMN